MLPIVVMRAWRAHMINNGEWRSTPITGRQYSASEGRRTPQAALMI